MATYDERYSALFRGGLRVHTTFDPNLQALAEQARNVLPDTEQGFDAAMVTLDTSTAAIRAMVGGRGFVPNERETNMALARQTGSSIKLFVLAAALQAGAQPNDIIDGASNCSFEVPNDEPFVIKNATEQGPDVGGDDVVVDQLRVRAAVADRRPQPSSTRRTAWPSRRTCIRANLNRTGIRSSRSSATPPAPTR